MLKHNLKQLYPMYNVKLVQIIGNGQIKHVIINDFTNHLSNVLSLKKLMSCFCKIK